MANFAVTFGIGLGLQLIGGLLTPPQRVGKLENRSLPDASFGSRIPIGYGAFPVRGILVAAPDELEEQTNTRGKLGGKVIEFTYFATLGYALARGPVPHLVQLKLSGDKELDRLSSNADVLGESSDFESSFTYQEGNASQSPNADLGLIHDPNPGYRDLTMIVFPDLDLTERFGNRPPLIEALISTEATMTTGSIDMVEEAPVQWTSTEATVNTPVDDLWVARAGTAEHSGSPITDQVVYTNALALEAGDFVEIIFDEVQEMTIGISSTTAPPYVASVTPNNTGNTLVFSEGPTATLLSTGGHSLRIERISQNSPFKDAGVDQIIFALDGQDVGFTVAATGTLYVVAELPDGSNPIYAIQGTGQAESVNRIQLGLVNLADVLDDICTKAGITADTTEIQDQILGVDLRGDSPKEWIEQLQEIFGFFVVPSGSGVKFLDGVRPAPVRTFATLDEFGTLDDRPYEWDRKQPTELAYEVEVTYYNIEFEQETSEYFRLDAQDPDDEPLTDSKVQISTNATMQPAEARGIAAMTLSRIWMQRETYRFTTTIENGDLEPGDTIEFPYLGEPQEFLITKIDYGANFLVEVEAYRYDRSPWENKETPTIDAGGTPVVSTTTPARLFVEEAPQITASHPSDPIYFGINQSTPAWNNSDLMISVDGGSSYERIGGGTSPATTGVTLSTLPSATAGSQDDTARLRVRCVGTLSTITQTTFDGSNKVNWIIVGQEILKFRDAFLLADLGTYSYYELVGLRRGLNSTSAPAHPKNEPFALTSTLQVFSKADVGGTGTAVQFNILLDGSEQAGKAPYDWTLP